MSLYSKVVPLPLRNILRSLKDPTEAILSFWLRFKSQNRILSGPFQGMTFRYSQQEYAMLLGTWELELVEVIERVLSSNYPLMVDVGAAEGYYAVGMAYRQPLAKVVAYEMEGRVRKNLEILQDLNGTSIDIRGKCEPKDLLMFKEGLEGAFILMDVEGYETILLDPLNIPSLSKATILVELHDMYAEGCSTLIKERFNRTHDIEQINGVQRSVTHFPKNAGWVRYFFSKKRLLDFMDEGRPHAMSWYYMVPKKE